MDNTLDPVLKTSDEWQHEHSDRIVLEAIGWNRKTYQYSWFEELITLEEFLKRRSRSMCINNDD